MQSPKKYKITCGRTVLKVNKLDNSVSSAKKSKKPNMNQWKIEWNFNDNTCNSTTHNKQVMVTKTVHSFDALFT